MLQSSKYNNLLSLNEILFYYLPQGKVDQNKHKRKAVSLFFFCRDLTTGRAGHLLD